MLICIILCPYNGSFFSLLKYYLFSASRIPLPMTVEEVRTSIFDMVKRSEPWYSGLRMRTWSIFHSWIQKITRVNELSSIKSPNFTPWPRWVNLKRKETLVLKFSSMNPTMTQNWVLVNTLIKFTIWEGMAIPCPVLLFWWSHCNVIIIFQSVSIWRIYDDVTM